MNRFLLLLLTFFASCQFTLAQYSTPSYNEKTVHHAAPIAHLEIPKTSSNEKIISHAGYSFVYSEAHEQANWIAYELTKEETVRLFKRSNKFKPDPMVTTGTATDSDYKKSGYDRGHLAPAADMGWSAQAMTESFYYSNMSPQTPGFNRGIWKKLEELIRSWAAEYHAVYIVTGPILTDGLPTIGNHKVSVPKYYYKIILEYNDVGKKGIGFIFPNESSKEPLQHFAVTIDEVEHVTGIDFFPALPDEQEKVIESSIRLKDWDWAPND